MSRIECLDGLRGLAAFWVLVGHCMILTGFSVPILGTPDLGVDLFILLSGFLMVFQYNLRRTTEDWNAPANWLSFWARRFFRLSSLYFTLLLAALLAGPAIYADRIAIDSFLDHDLQQPERYLDGSPANIALHMTYLYGLIPQYAFRTPLPDWSLGLEMQFYAVFPLAMLMVRKMGWLPAAVAMAGLAATVVISLKLAGITFPMPSLLALKMRVFLAGMLTAAAIGRPKPAFFLLGLTLVLIPIGGDSGKVHLAARGLLFAGCFALVHWRDVATIDRLSLSLGSPGFHWLGELSYGVYLVHLLVLHRVAAWTIEAWGHDMSAMARFGLTFAIVAPVAYGLAYLTYRTIERPGQRFGRRVLGAFIPGRHARQTSGEEIGAP